MEKDSLKQWSSIHYFSIPYLIEFSLSDDNERPNTINRCVARLVYLPSLGRSSRLLVSNSLGSTAALKESKDFSLWFLRFGERILVTNKWNKLHRPKICYIVHELPLLYLLQEAKKEKNKNNKEKKKRKICRWYEARQTENCLWLGKI